MELFFNTIMQFPVIVLTFLLCIAIVYWLIAALGIVEVDVLDFDMEIDGVVQGKLEGALEAFAGLLMRLGLVGIPITLLLTVLFFFAWLVGYFVQLLLLNHLPLGWFVYPIGIVVLIGALFVAMFCTVVICRPLGSFFRKAKSMNSHPTILGRTAVLRSGKVTPSFGEALLEDGGAGLLLKVRAKEPNSFKRGDRVVLIEYIADQHVYYIVSESEFSGS
ncbi:hypothetical protein VQ643_09020 [Pseudomonas sp. F1_0610]|uniref:hypothetical protein n=1 Tax=Pseudomonas sp. F1_0610 TaxID=3114284 RepID=UPI0039C3DD38